jgi:DNA-directed RNA polymerase alpha subunit
VFSVQFSPADLDALADIRLIPGLSARAINALTESGLTKTADVTALTYRELRNIPGISTRTASHIKEVLGYHDLRLAEY